MGLELLMGKAGALGAAILGFLALLLGAFFKGKRAERQKAELEALRATQETQKRVGEAQAGDAALDAEVRKKVEAAKKVPPGGQVGGKYEL